MALLVVWATGGGTGRRDRKVGFLQRSGEGQVVTGTRKDEVRGEDCEKWNDRKSYN